MKWRGWLIFAMAVLGSGAWFGRGPLRDLWFETQRPALPRAESYYERTEPEQTGGIERIESGGAEREGERTEPANSNGPINLAVPFTSQAPYGVWDAVHKDVCEEAALLMVDAFFDGRALTPDSVEAELLALVDWQKERFGYFEDTSAVETAVIAREYYGYRQVEVRYDIVADDLREAVRRGLPVIIPLDGRMIGNPFYSGVGPEYHMLVIRGLTADGKFITNDPGTRRGEAYLYDPQILWEAIYDWNGGSGPRRKVMIVIRP